MLSPKENLLRMYRGELPEYLPRGGFREFKCSAFIDVKALMGDSSDNVPRPRTFPISTGRPWRPRT